MCLMSGESLVSYIVYTNWYLQEVEHVVFTSVACGSGDAHTLAVSSDGKVWSWGDGDYGKLGRGS